MRCKHIRATQIGCAKCSLEYLWHDELFVTFLTVFKQGGDSALTVAVENGRMEVVSLLLKAGAAPGPHVN